MPLQSAIFTLRPTQPVLLMLVRSAGGVANHLGPSYGQLGLQAFTCVILRRLSIYCSSLPADSILDVAVL
jgi:hypothetical protein